jgi:hypothetical protein
VRGQARVALLEQRVHEAVDEWRQAVEDGTCRVGHSGKVARAAADWSCAVNDVSWPQQLGKPPR